MTLADIDGDILSAKAIPYGTEDALLARTMPAQVSRYGFNQIFASSPDPANWNLIKAGSGQTVSQANSALVLAAGTTANAETIIRGLTTFQGALRMRLRSFLSQRIANQQFIAELTDVIGDALAITINSATSVSVTIPNNPFTSASVGQSMFLGGYTGTGTFIPGRYTIASVSGNVVTFTVAGFAAGSGTCSVFGWNYHHVIYDGTSLTNAKWDTQRKGWNTGDTTITSQSSASPGHLMALYQNDLEASVMDALISSQTGVQFSTRGSRMENVPDDIPMYLQIRVVNGSTAPASATSWTIGQVSVTNWAPQDVVLQEIRPMHPMSPLPVQFAATQNVNVSNTPIVTSRPDGANATAFAGETTAAVFSSLIKASGGSLFEITVSNLTSSDLYVKLYNKASAAVASTDTPVNTFKVSANSDRQLEFGANGKRFPTGIAIAMTGAASKTDTTALAAGTQISGSYV
jgi:hypothetical protein